MLHKKPISGPARRGPEHFSRKTTRESKNASAWSRLCTATIPTRTCCPMSPRPWDSSPPKTSHFTIVAPGRRGPTCSLETENLASTSACLRGRRGSPFAVSGNGFPSGITRWCACSTAKSGRSCPERRAGRIRSLAPPAQRTDRDGNPSARRRGQIFLPLGTGWTGRAGSGTGFNTHPLTSDRRTAVQLF